MAFEALPRLGVVEEFLLGVLFIVVFVLALDSADGSREMSTFEPEGWLTIDSGDGEKRENVMSAQAATTLMWRNFILFNLSPKRDRTRRQELARVNISDTA